MHLKRKIYKKGKRPNLKKKLSQKGLDGKSKGMSPLDIAQMHHMDYKDFYKELKRGTNHELEHTKNKALAERIALDHLYEDPKYYEKLETAGLKHGGLTKDSVINRVLKENSEEILSLDFDDTEMFFDEETNRRFWVKRIGEDKFLIEESGSLAKGQLPSVLFTAKELEGEHFKHGGKPKDKHTHRWIYSQNVLNKNEGGSGVSILKRVLTPDNVKGIKVVYESSPYVKHTTFKIFATDRAALRKAGEVLKEHGYIDSIKNMEDSIEYFGEKK